MEKNIDSSLDNLNNFDFWLNEPFKKDNIKPLFVFLSNLEPEFKEELIEIQKKILKKNKSALSLLITFTSTNLKNNKNENLKALIKKLIQTLMDNPKGLK